MGVSHLLLLPIQLVILELVGKNLPCDYHLSIIEHDLLVILGHDLACQ